MSSLLLLTNALQPSTEVLPALGLLLHNVRVAPAEGPALVDTPGADVILIDGRRDLPQVRSLCQLLRSTGPGCPLILVVTEGGLAAVTADWGIDDVLLDTAGPAEVEARLRLAMGRQQIVNDDSPMEIRNGDLSVDEATYSAKLKGRVLDLTFKEFELLKYLAQHRAVSSRAPSCFRRSGATTTSAVRGRSTSTYGGCARSSDPSTSR